MPESEDRPLIDALSAGGPVAWQTFLDRCSDTVFRVVGLFASTYDERMDLFLFVCARLHKDDMRRLRSYRFRPETPCRFSTWLTVVVKNLAVDHQRSREGRFRPFRRVEAMDPIDRHIFDYHLRDGRPLEEVKHLLAARHGVVLRDGELAARAARVEAGLSASQRWKLLARLAERRHHVRLDPVTGGPAERGAGGSPALADERGDPEKALRSREAGRAVRSAMASIPARERLAVTLRYRDDLGPREIATVLGVAPADADRMVRDGLRRVRDEVRRRGIVSGDLADAETEVFMGAETAWADS